MQKLNILIKPQFVEPIRSGRKIHTIRANYEFWKRFDYQECSIRVWTGKPRRSPQREVFKRIIHVQPIRLWHNKTLDGHKMPPEFYATNGTAIENSVLAKNDGFESVDDFMNWFYNYKDGILAVLHFTNFWYEPEGVKT
jgi:hypothetical protein